MTACTPVPAPPIDAADLFVVVQGARLRYRDEGSGPAVLLVHGWTLDLEMWNPQVSLLRSAFRLIRLDRRGHGLSGGVPDPRRDGADLEALCNHLQLPQAAFIGMSQGVRGVLEFACAAPRRVAALILDGPPSLDCPWDAELPMQRYAALMRTHGIEAFRSEWVRHPLMQLRTQDPDARALLAAMIARYTGSDLRQESRAEPAAARLPLESLQVPALILSGEYDLPSRRRDAEQLAARLPRAQCAVIPAAGHLANLDRPHTYSLLCRDFLSRHCDRAIS